MLHTHLMVTDRLLVAQGRWLNSALARRALSSPAQCVAIGGLGDPGSAGPAKVAQVRDLG